MIDQFSNLIQLSKECCDFTELTTSITEIDALKEGISKFDFTKIELTNKQLNILFNDNTNSLIRQIIDQSSGIISTFGQHLTNKKFTKNLDFLFLLEFFSKFNDSNPLINFDQISSETIDPLSYFLFVQQIFDSISTIPLNMNTEQNALSDIIKYIILHTKNLSLIENISGLNNEILLISKNIHGANLQLFKPIFQESYIKSIVHKNRISKDTINNSPKILLEQSEADQSLITKLNNERESYYTLLSTLSSLIYYKNYLKNDIKNTFYPYGQLQGEISNEVKSNTTFLIDKLGQLLSNGKTVNGIYTIRLSVNWEKQFKGTRLSNASFIEITYQNSKKTYEINDQEGSFIEIVLPSFSKNDDKVDISLVYVKEKFNDTIRKDVPIEGIGTLSSFTYSLKADNNNSTEKIKTKSKTSSVMYNNDDFIVEFKRGDTSLSTKCGTVILNSKFYDFKDDGVPEILQNNYYLTKSDSNGYSDDFQMKQFLNFLITNLVNQWILTSTKSGSISMSIYPPHEAYIGLIEFSMRYSIPASTIYLQISKKLLSAWCHSESYLNAFTAVFITSHVCMMNNKKRFNNLYVNKEEEELYRYINEFLEKNVPLFLIQHLSKAGVYQRHGLIPLFMLLSFVIPEEKIDSYVDQLIQYSHKNIIVSIISYLKPTKLESKEKNSEKMTQGVSHLLEFINSYKSSSFDKIMNNENEVDFTKIEPSKITFSISSLADTIEVLNKRTLQLNKFYEDNSLPSFLSNQWETIENELCQFTVLLVKTFLIVLKEKFGDDQSIFKFIFSYRDLHDFYMKSSQQKIKSSEIKSEEFSPFKLFENVILDWMGRIGKQMNIWITKAVNIDTFEIEDKKLKTSTSPKDMFEVFRQSFNFLYSLHWDDPSIEVFVYTFLGLCGTCLRNFIETLTIRMLSYFPLEVIEESQIEAIMHYHDDLESEQKNQKSKNSKFKKKKEKRKSKNDNDDDDNDSDSSSNNNIDNEAKTKITTRSIFVIINNFINLRLMWNGFLVHAKKIFPSLFPENDENGMNISQRISLHSAGNSSSLLNSSNIVSLPENIMDPVPKITGITNSIPTLFSFVTSHLVTDTVSPHLWIKNSTVKQIFVKNASKYILNPEFFKTCSPIYVSIFDTILNYIKDRINDINATTCMKYYKTMIVSFLFGLDSGMMNLLVRNKKKSWPIKNKRLIPILNFIQDIYKEVYQYVYETSLENVFTNDEKLENYTPHSVFMFNHIKDDPEQLIDLVSKNCPKETIDASNEQDPQFLNALCIYIIVSSQTNDKRSNIVNWIQEYKAHFKKRRFYPPKYK